MPDHEGHLGGGDGFGGYDEVGFVFAGGVVEDDDELVGAEGFDYGGDIVELRLGDEGFRGGRHCDGCDGELVLSMRGGVR